MPNDVDYLGLGHVAAALLAMLTGLVVVLRPKGTRFHRGCGRAYVAAMLALNASALSIYDLFGGFGPFHAAALFSLLTVGLGVHAAWRRRPAGHWMEVHAYWMSWSYVGLLAAAVSESATRYLDLDFGLTVAAASITVLAAGGWVIRRNVPRLVRPGGVARASRKASAPRA